MSTKNPDPFKREIRHGHPYCMYEEIYSQPKMIAETISLNKEKTGEIASKIVDMKPKRVFLIGCGTSFYAALSGRYALSNIAGITAEALPSFELLNYVPAKALKSACVISVSHTGATRATVGATSFAKNNGSYTVSITAFSKSPIAEFSDEVIITPGGRDRAGPMTRSYITELVALHMLAIQSAKINPETADLGRSLETQITTLSGLVETFLKENDNHVQDIAEICHCRKIIFFLGAGPNWPTALEASLKVQEATRIYSCGFELEEVAHGPRVLLDKDSVVVIIEPDGKALQRSLSVAKGLSELGALIIVLTSKGESELTEIANEKILMRGEIDELISPILYIVPLQLLTYYISIKKGLNPDVLRRDEQYIRSSKILSTRLT